MSPIDYARARETMVEQQVRPWDVLDLRVLDTLSMLPRDAFVPEACRALAYTDMSLPLGHGEVMLKPVVEGRVLQALALQPQDDVLEVGTGSGWFAACMGRLARSVLSLELRDDFVVAARARLAAQGLDGNVEVEIADALGYVPSRQFVAFCICGAVLLRRWAAAGEAVTEVTATAPPASASANPTAEPYPRMRRAEGDLRSIVVNSPDG